MYASEANPYNMRRADTIQSQLNAAVTDSLDGTLDLLPSRLRLCVFCTLGGDLGLYLFLSPPVDVLLPCCPDYDRC